MLFILILSRKNNFLIVSNNEGSLFLDSRRKNLFFCYFLLFFVVFLFFKNKNTTKNSKKQQKKILERYFLKYLWECIWANNWVWLVCRAASSLIRSPTYFWFHHILTPGWSGSSTLCQSKSILSLRYHLSHSISSRRTSILFICETSMPLVFK